MSSYWLVTSCMNIISHKGTWIKCHIQFPQEVSAHTASTIIVFMIFLKLCINKTSRYCSGTKQANGYQHAKINGNCNRKRKLCKRLSNFHSSFLKYTDNKLNYTTNSNDQKCIWSEMQSPVYLPESKGAGKETKLVTDCFII